MHSGGCATGTIASHAEISQQPFPKAFLLRTVFLNAVGPRLHSTATPRHAMPPPRHATATRWTSPTAPPCPRSAFWQHLTVIPLHGSACSARRLSSYRPSWERVPLNSMESQRHPFAWISAFAFCVPSTFQFLGILCVVRVPLSCCSLKSMPPLLPEPWNFCCCHLRLSLPLPHL